MTTPSDFPKVDESLGVIVSSSTAQDVDTGSVAVQGIDVEAERRVLRKVDLHTIPWVMLMYLLSFLDRVNIGNARLYGMEADLDLTGNRFQIMTSILFVTYVTCELPSNLLIKRMKPSRWIGFLAISWGIIATCMGLVQSYGGALACRVLLGGFEAGLFPGLTVYLTLFYTKRELALRVAFLFVSAAVAGAFGGLFAYAIGHMDGVAGYRGWRWIFILEGIPTVVAGIGFWVFVPDEPESCSYLTSEERNTLIMKRNRQPGYSAAGLQLHAKDVLAALQDWRIWIMSFGLFGSDTMLYGYSTFLPTIVHSLGTWTTAEVQALTIPCYTCGAIVYLILAWLSDKQQRRAVYAVGSCLVSIVGYIILLSDASSSVHYFGCIVVACGLYAVVGIPLSWLPTNCPRYGKRVTASGLQVTLGNMGGVVAPFLFPTEAGPRYTVGFATTLALVAWAAAVYSFIGLAWHRINQNRDAKVAGERGESTTELGDLDPHFRYTC